MEQDKLLIEPFEEFLKNNWSLKKQGIHSKEFLKEDRLKDSYVEHLLNDDLENMYSSSENSDSEPNEIINEKELLYFNKELLKIIQTFPKSQLNAKEQEIYFSIMFRNIGRDLAHDKHFYNKFTPIVIEEQITFQNFALERNKGKTLKISEQIKLYITKALEHRYLRVQKYPQYYVSKNIMIPIFYGNEKPPLEMQFLSHMQTLGLIPLINIPNLKHQVNIIKTFKKADLRFPTQCDNIKKLKENILYKQPVSQDLNALYFALQSEADIVISSSGINRLIETIHDNKLEWEIPISIKTANQRYSLNKQTIIFVDKPWPAKKMSVAKQMNWYYKLASKNLLTNRNNPNSIYFKLPKCSCSNNNDDSEGDDSNPDQFYIDCNCEDKLSTPSYHDNFSYNLWKISRKKNDYIKQHDESISQLKILVRNRVDGHLDKTFMTIRSKIELKPEMGCEHLTTQEIHHIWSNLFFKPNTNFLNVRINSEFQEVMTIDTIKPRDLNINPAPIFGTLFAVLSELKSQPVGEYLLKHTEGAFCELLTASDKGEDYHQSYSKGPEEINFPNSEFAPLIPLSPLLCNNYHRKYMRIPLTFPPVSSTQRKSKLTRNKRGRKKRTA